MSILIENLISQRSLDMISEQMLEAEINYVSTAGTISKKGYNAYRQYINSLKTEFHKENNNIRQSTVWEKIKKLEVKKDGI